MGKTIVCRLYSIFLVGLGPSQTVVSIVMHQHRIDYRDIKPCVMENLSNYNMIISGNSITTQDSPSTFLRRFVCSISSLVVCCTSNGETTISQRDAYQQSCFYLWKHQCQRSSWRFPPVPKCNRIPSSFIADLIYCVIRALLHLSRLDPLKSNATIRGWLSVSDTDAPPKKRWRSASYSFYYSLGMRRKKHRTGYTIFSDMVCCLLSKGLSQLHSTKRSASHVFFIRFLISTFSLCVNSLMKLFWWLSAVFKSFCSNSIIF